MRTRLSNLRSSPVRARVLVTAMVIVGALVMAGSSSGAFPGVNGDVAFTSDRDGNWEIYVMKADGSGQTRLTNNAALDFGPAWSPDGTKLAFASTREGNAELYVMNADGSGQTRLTSSNDARPEWSPDGTRIAFVSDRDGNSEIYVMNADGSGQTRLTYDAAFDAYPAWSPDGSKLAFWSNRDGNDAVYVMNADGTGQTRLTPTNSDNFEPAWSPDGTKLAFVSDRDGGVWTIYVMNEDGSGQTRLTDNVASDDEPAWSPDGSKLVFRSTRDRNEEIYVMNADGSGQTRLTNNAARDFDPDWQTIRDHSAPAIFCESPDGIWHANDVSFSCTAQDALSGLADPADASFSLATSVASGVETANASTGTRNVCDRAGNCVTAGPIDGNKVDKKVPTISLSSPASTTYLLHQSVPADYACFDPGSGIASCAAPVPSGADINTAVVGSKMFTVKSVDNVGNAAPSRSANYTVAYGVRLLFDPSQPAKTLMLQLIDANGANVSSATIAVTVTTIDGGSVSGQTFSFSKNPATYKYTPKVSAGSHTLTFAVSSDPTTHTFAFVR